MSVSACVQPWQNNHSIEILDDHSFVDSMGETFVVEQAYEKVITLYSAHTENAFTIGGGDQIIGVGTTSIYPPEAALLPRYDYRSDPEPLIASEPDLVIVRPFINRNYGDFVSSLKKAGIEVVSLYPEDREAFEAYVKALGIIFGKSDLVLSELKALEDRLNAIEAKTSSVDMADKVQVYFEATKTAYRTVTVDSNPARAIEIAGGINIASDVEPMTKGSTIAEFGIERLMLLGEEIDVYVSQRGAMNAGGSLISIPQRQGFDSIKAVDEGRILELNEKIISSPTFRYDRGVMEMARTFYPDLMDDLSSFDYAHPLTRESYAQMTVRLNHTPIFVPSSSHYYEQNHLVHTYGMLEDVSWQSPMFDWIETAVIHSYIKANVVDGREVFHGEALVTRNDLAYTLYIMKDIKGQDSSIEIMDLEACLDPKIVQKVVDNGYMTLDEEGNFNGQAFVTGSQALKVLTNEGLYD